MKELKFLKVYPIIEFGFGEYQYFVDTPNDGTLYFKDKKQAKEFIEFYQTYTDRPKKCIETN